MSAAIMEHDGGLPRAEAERLAQAQAARPSMRAPERTEADRLVERYGELALDVLGWRNFAASEPDEVLELTVLVPGRGPWVAHATSCESMIRLCREGGRITGGSGVYVVANKVAPEIVARDHPDEWHPARNGRASDSDIECRRVVYVDIDPSRPKGISATDEEKSAARRVAQDVERFLVGVLGDDRSIGRGDSGNGCSIFVAIEPRPVEGDDAAGIARLLAALNARFGTEAVHIDQKVANPARLVPAFGTQKRKGVSTRERPHRRTYFTCRPTVRRVPLELLTDE